MTYLIQNTLVYRVPTVNDALQLREELEKNGYGELSSFTYQTKQIKQKGEVVEEYQQVKAVIKFTSEKEPDQCVEVEYH